MLFRIIRFFLINPSTSPGYTSALLRLVLGTFFFSSGFNKVFTLHGQQVMLETITSAGVPFPSVMAIVVASFECFGGLLLAFGLLSRLWALALLVISTVALFTVGLGQIPGNINFITWYSWLFYLPEPLYIVIALTILIDGPGKFALDNVLARK